MSAIDYILVGVLLLIFFVFGIAASIATVRRLVEIIRCGRFPRWDEKIELSFREAPISGGFYLLHLLIMLLAALACALWPAWFVANSI